MSVTYCRCGVVPPVARPLMRISYEEVSGYRMQQRTERRDPNDVAQWAQWDAWFPGHEAKGHQIISDGYRAACRPEAALKGCRQCGRDPTGRKLYYCSNECKEEFEQNHFWGTARWTALTRVALHLLDDRWPIAYRCEICGGWMATSRGMFAELREHLSEEELHEITRSPMYGVIDEAIEKAAPEVNHIVPVNGLRENFSCLNHQDNLEVLHHACHVAVTNRQRAEGLIG